MPRPLAFRTVMLYESSGVHVEADDGIATLWLDFPGLPVNALSPQRLEEIVGGVRVAVATPGVEILVVRSSKPGGFCGGADGDSLRLLTTPADRADYSRTGQRLLSELAEVPFPTVAFVHGPCLGPGLELALACGIRLGVSGPDSAVGFPDVGRGMVPCWGGTTRLVRLLGRRAAESVLASGQRYSGREAVGLGLFHDAFSERRAKIELLTVLDALQRTSRSPFGRRFFSIQKSRSASVSCFPVVRAITAAAARSRTEGESAERTWFSRGDVTPSARPQVSRLRVDVVGFDGQWTPESAEIIGRVILRGGRVNMPDPVGAEPAVERFLREQVRRGFVTPLEVDEARKRIVKAHLSSVATFVLRSVDTGLIATVTGMYPVPFEISGDVAVIRADCRVPATVTDRAAAWLTHLGYETVVRRTAIPEPLSVRVRTVA